MALPDTFAWEPTSAGYAPTTTMLVRTAQYGDGYAQTVPDGINNVSSNYSLVFIKNRKDMAAIIAFLDAHQGATAFYFTPLFRPQGLYKCPGYTGPTKDGNVYTLTATFNESFAP